MSHQGGLYLIRCRKPGALMGLSLLWMLVAGALLAIAGLIVGQGWWSLLGFLTVLFSGRHNAYVGLTNSYYHRKNQHLYGDVRWAAAPKPWADLAPKFYRIWPLPDAITHKGAVFRGRWILETLELLLIWLLIPVYNRQKQAPWNLRQISAASAQRQRWAREQLGWGYRLMRTVLRGGLALVLIGGAAWAVTR